MTFFTKFIDFLKSMFVHIHFSLRVKVSRSDSADDEKSINTDEGGKENE